MIAQKIRVVGSGCALWSLWLMLTVATGMAHAANTVTYVYTDPQGTPLAEADVNGNITATYNYTPYGTMAPNMSAPPNGPGYTGHVNDPDTGFVYMQARYYDPAVGRFLSADPNDVDEGNTFNFNRYIYANNNPLSFTDPTGRASQPPVSQPAWYQRALASVEKVLNSPAAQKAEAQIGEGMLAASEGEMDGGAAPIIDEAADNALNDQLNQVSDPNRPYSNLQDSKFVGAGKAITNAQKAKAAAQNMLRNGGQLKSDEDGTPLVPGQKSQSGVTPPANEVAFDHYNPRNPSDPSATRGSNSYSNIRIISRGQNGQKSNTPPKPPSPALHSLNE